MTVAKNGMPVIVVPDTHGHLRHVEQLISHLRRLRLLDDHWLVFLGDYFDRGPDVRGLVDLAIELQRKGHVFLAGNHEYVLERALAIGSARGSCILRWALSYEDETLCSYGLSRPVRANQDAWRKVADALWQAMPEAHQNFLRSLPWVFESEQVIVVHAGLVPHTDWSEQIASLRAKKCDDPRGPPQLFSRELACAMEHSAPKLVVSGHVANRSPRRGKHRLLLHCGVDWGGPLVAWVSDTDQLISIS